MQSFETTGLGYTCSQGKFWAPTLHSSPSVSAFLLVSLQHDAWETVGSYMLGDKTRDVDVDLSGPVLVPAYISGVRTSFMIKTGNPQAKDMG